jgi:hypothetical protein
VVTWGREGVLPCTTERAATRRLTNSGLRSHPAVEADLVESGGVGGCRDELRATAGYIRPYRAHAGAIAAPCARPDTFAVELHPRRPWLRPRQPSLMIRDLDDSGHHVLTEDADWGYTHVEDEPGRDSPVAATVQVLCQQVPQGLPCERLVPGTRFTIRRRPHAMN